MAQGRIRKPLGIDLGSRTCAVALLDPTDSAILTGQDEHGCKLFPRTSPNPFATLRDGMMRVLNGEPHTLDTVVLAVPPHLDEKERAALAHAAKEAGLAVLEMLPEPIAIVHYHVWLHNHGDAVYLIVDVGATCTVSVVRRAGDEAEVVASRHDPRLGGDAVEGLIRDDIDRIIELGRQVSHEAGMKHDHVILAGDSAPIPLLRQTVQTAFCNEAELLSDEPKLCVAYGAALRGASHGTQYVDLPGDLELHLTSLPRTQTLPYSVTGRVSGLGAEALREGGSIRIRSFTTGMTEEVYLRHDMEFCQEIEVQPDEDNPLEVDICDPAGQVVVRLTTSARHGKAARVTPQNEPAPRTPPVHGQVLEPSWQQFTKLVRHCLDLAADAAETTGRQRQELFEHIYAQERYAERAHEARNQDTYHECVENLTQYAEYLDQMRQDALPEPLPPPERDPEEEARETMEQFRGQLTEVWKRVRAASRGDLEERLKQVAKEGSGLSTRLKTDAPEVLRELRRLLGEVESVAEAMGE